ncbi:DnaB-like helicase C-terminal domain-containing protein [Fundicoccus sp. Sow4_H7]|uniref:DnaB-like helicase C-terminal domain-containing protein n=1 Tax=Fundicoccus sp. Sow4_H7 TaxID=3438784 RepID=UPI003F907313
MEKQQAQTLLKSKIGEYLESKGIDPTRKFKCLNPEHDDKNPSMGLIKNGDRVYCFSCQQRYDVFDLIGLDYGIDGLNNQFNKAIEIFDIDVLSNSYQPLERNFKQNIDTQTEPETDYSEFILKAHEQINKTDYPAQRGLTEKTINKFKIGYDPQWQNPLALEKALKNSQNEPPKQPYLIIPNSNNSYFARCTSDKVSETYQKQKVGKSELFYKQGISPSYNNGYVFIVEGQIDALSFYEIDQVAIGLGGTGDTEFIKAINDALTIYDKSELPVFYLLFDNDSAGQKANQKLYNALNKHQLQVHSIHLPGNYKDANDFLVANRGEFKAFIDDAIENPSKYERGIFDNDMNNLDQLTPPAEPANSLEQSIRDEINQANLDDYTINNIPYSWHAYLTDDEIKQLNKNTSPAHHLSNFLQGINANANTPAISTGFKQFDKTLDGGLYEGLYIIGAISSLGKTTLALQIADQIAQGEQEQDVLIFSLEMSRSEIMAKTISRLTYENALLDDIPTNNAKTTRGITDGRRYKGYTDAYGNEHKPYNNTEKNLIIKSVNQYQTFAKRLFIHEGMGNIGVEQVRNAVEEHVKVYGKAPVILIDYLQILAPYDTRATDKQNTDKAVLELKRISRDFKTPVLAISSFNRENYSNSVSMLAFKESGAIEYSSDVLIGLQFAKQREIEEYNRNKKVTEPKLVLDHDAQKSKEPREIELKILKNRNGETGGHIDFYFNAKFNHFSETDEIGFSLNIKDTSKFKIV